MTGVQVFLLFLSFMDLYWGFCDLKSGEYFWGSLCLLCGFYFLNKFYRFYVEHHENKEKEETKNV